MTSIPTRHIDMSHPAIQLAVAYSGARRRSEALCEPLGPEDMQVQSMPDASPVKWHLAHTSWFFETFLLTPKLDDYRPIDVRYRDLFNSYYEGVGEPPPRPERGLVSRPFIEEVRAYRAHVDEEIYRLISLAYDDNELAGLLALGISHEQQHQELMLMDIKHAFSRNLIEPVFERHGLQPRRAAPVARWRNFEGGKARIGHEGDGFAYDNEGPAHHVWLEPYRLSDRLVSCGDWLAFMQDGGYADPQHWLADGWRAVQANGWEAPEYWRRDGEAWTLFTLQGRRAVDPAEPVCHVSYYEADAFARWAGYRLPTEAEWEAASGGRLEPEGGRLHPTVSPSVGEGLTDLTGQVWQWTSSAYGAYPRYRPATGPIGEYNGKFMCGQMVLRGGACVTPPGHSRTTYRNYYPPEARWAFSGLRLADDG